MKTRGGSSRSANRRPPSPHEFFFQFSSVKTKKKGCIASNRIQKSCFWAWPPSPRQVAISSLIFQIRPWWKLHGNSNENLYSFSKKLFNYKQKLFSPYVIWFFYVNKKPFDEILRLFLRTPFLELIDLDVVYKFMGKQ